MARPGMARLGGARIPMDLLETYMSNRSKAFERDGFQCQGCHRTQKQCRDAGDWLEAHHKPMSYVRGKEKVEDLLTLCCICHNSITTARRSIRYRGYRPPEVSPVLKPEKQNVPEVREFNIPVSNEGDS